MRMAFRGTATRRREDTSLYAGGLLSLWCRLNPMNGPPRIVIALSSVQVFFVTAGYFVTRSSLKLFDRVVPEMLGSHTPAIPALPQFIRSHGLWCLLVPLAWSVIATSRADRSEGVASLTLEDSVAGMVLTLSLALLFSIGTLRAIQLTFGAR